MVIIQPRHQSLLRAHAPMPAPTRRGRVRELMFYKPCKAFTDTSTAALYLNRFRGEPAIPGPYWFFTANLNSSQNIATFTGSGCEDSPHPGQN